MQTVVETLASSWSLRLDCGHHTTLLIPAQPGSRVECPQCHIEERNRRMREVQEQDDALRHVVQALRARGIASEYWNSGGGCMVVRCEVNPYYEWVFGCQDGMWGADFSRLQPLNHLPDGHLFSVETSYSWQEKIPTICNWIWSLLSIVPFVGESGQYIIDAYTDETAGFPVDPWEYYHLPYPDPSHVEGNSMQCENCMEQFTPGDIDAMQCIRCCQPDPNGE